MAKKPTRMVTPETATEMIAPVATEMVSEKPATVADVSKVNAVKAEQQKRLVAKVNMFMPTGTILKSGEAVVLTDADLKHLRDAYGDDIHHIVG